MGASIMLCQGSPPQPRGEPNSISHCHCGLRQELPNCTFLYRMGYKAGFCHRSALWPSSKHPQFMDKGLTGSWDPPRVKLCRRRLFGSSPGQWDALSKLKTQEQQHHFQRTVHLMHFVCLKMRWTTAWKCCLLCFNCPENQLQCKKITFTVLNWQIHLQATSCAVPVHTNSWTKTKRFAALTHKCISLFRVSYMKLKQTHFVDDLKRERDLWFVQVYYYVKSIFYGFGVIFYAMLYFC